MLNFMKKKEDKVKEKINLTLDQQIEAILFAKNDEVSLNSLTKLFGLKKKEILESIEILKERLSHSALNIISNNDKFLLSTRVEAAPLLKEFVKKSELGELSPSALETISIVLYKKEISRAELDKIRGVNSSYILRNLLIRGLVEKKQADGVTKYTPTLDLLSFLGVPEIEKMPGFEKVQEELSKLENNLENTELIENKE
jgi:segregation and condensation protein B